MKNTVLVAITSLIVSANVMPASAEANENKAQPSVSTKENVKKPLFHAKRKLASTTVAPDAVDSTDNAQPAGDYLNFGTDNFIIN